MTFKRKILILLGAFALFFAYAWFPLMPGDLWNSPDESAAAFFATNMPIFGEYDIPAVFVSELGGIVHPRSMNVVNGQLVPNMWLGLSWMLGLVHSATGLSAGMLDVVISVFAVLAVFAWYQIVLKFTQDNKVALFSSIALAVHPGWWYFTARGLHPNVLFVCMIIFTVYFWYVAVHKMYTDRHDIWRELMLFLGGFAFGMAVFIRTNEFVWLAPVLLFVAWRARRMPFSELFAVFIGLLIPMVIMLQLNSSIFGSAFTSGYSAVVDTAVVQVESVGLVEKQNALMRYIFPFGIHEMNVLRNVWNFHFEFFALWTFFALYGAFLIAVRWKDFPQNIKEKLRVIVVVASGVSLYLFILYGSWNLNDNPDPNAITIGTSYIRYWLPVTLIMSPLIGYAIATGFAKGRSEARKTILMIIWIGSLILSGIQITFFGKDEGLVFIKDRIYEFEQERSFLIFNTSKNDILIVDRSDKIIFPNRNVVVPLRDETVYGSLPLMLDAVENNDGALYYYGITLPQKDLDFLQETRLDSKFMTIESVGSMGDKTLYRLLKND